MKAEISRETFERVIEEDHRLEAQATKSTRALMEHRWHWTLDESNPERMPIRDYARHVGRSTTTIAKHANGYLLLLDNEQAREQDGGVRAITPTDAYELAGAGEERRAATEAVMHARGVSAVNARQHHGEEVRRVREIARDRAERNHTSVVDEAEAAAAALREEQERERRYEEQRRKEQEERKQRHTFRYISADGYAVKAKEDLRKMLQEVEGVNFDKEERDLLLERINEVRRLVDTIDQSVAGHSAPDWGEKVRILASSD